MREDLINRIDTIWGAVKSIASFFVSLIEFLIKTGKLLFTYLGRAFQTIFSEDFFDGLVSYFEEIYKYMGTAWGTVFVSLFILVFFILVFQFIMRVLRGRVNYNASINRLRKQQAKKG